VSIKTDGVAEKGAYATEKLEWRAKLHTLSGAGVITLIRQLRN
jgi:hypothetical protein